MRAPVRVARIVCKRHPPAVPPQPCLRSAARLQGGRSSATTLEVAGGTSSCTCRLRRLRRTWEEKLIRLRSLVGEMQSGLTPRRLPQIADVNSVPCLWADRIRERSIRSNRGFKEREAPSTTQPHLVRHRPAENPKNLRNCTPQKAPRADGLAGRRRR